MTATYLDLNAIVGATATLIGTRRGADLQATPKLIDRVVQEELREIGRLVAQQLFAAAARAAVAQSRAEAAKRGTPLSIERSPIIRFKCVFGRVEVVSPYLRSRAPAPAPVDPTTPFWEDTPVRAARPVNDALDVRGGGMTLQLRRALADFGLDSSFEMAAAKALEHYGITVDRTTVRSVTLKEGAVAERRARSAPIHVAAAAVPGPPLLVEMDGSAVRTGKLVDAGGAELSPKRKLPKRKRVTAWRDLRLGFVRRLDDEGEGPIFVGGILPLDEVTDRLRGEALGFGWTPRTLTVRVSDGGHGVREAMDCAFSVGPHILDQPHLHHHLYETAEAMGHDEPHRAELAAQWSARLARGAADSVIAELARHQGKGQDRAVQLSGYLTRFQDAVTYDEFKRQGYPIGSGEIESAHKGKVQVRMKLPGTWWTPANANALLALRLCRANRRWAQHWRDAAQTEAA